LVVALFAVLAISFFVSSRAALSQDATTDSTTIDSAAIDSAAGADANWDSTGPALDEDADSAEKVLEIPQVACAEEGASGSCSDADADDDDSQAINAPQPGSPPSLDDDTASAGGPGQDWGSVDDYRNEEAYAVPYALYPYPASVVGANVVGSMNRPSQFPSSAFVPMSSPLTPAARPPLNPGPWMARPSMSAFSRPAGSPMMPMRMSGGAFGFHR
jgi:hypothetical protein